MNIKIIYSNRKTLALQIRDGKVYARAPYGTVDATIQRFVESKADWIQKHLDRYIAPGYQTGQKLRVFGVWVSVEISTGSRFQLMLVEDVLHVTCPLNTSEERIAKAIDAHFKSHLQTYLKQYIETYAKCLNIAPPPFKIRKYKRLHGRCSRVGELAFNTYLYHEAPEFIEYVVLHECAHIFEFNHSHRFYAIIQQHMPDYKARIKRQKERKQSV